MSQRGVSVATVTCICMKWLLGRMLGSSSIPLKRGLISGFKHKIGVTLWVEDTTAMTQHLPATCLALLLWAGAGPVLTPLVPELACPALLLAGLGSSLRPEHMVS